MMAKGLIFSSFCPSRILAMCERSCAVRNTNSTKRPPISEQSPSTNIEDVIEYICTFTVFSLQAPPVDTSSMF